MNTTARNRQGMYRVVMDQFEHAADIMGLDPGVRKILSRTNSEIVVHFPVKLDDGSIEVFTGYRVHNNALGPYKGGLRYHQTVDLDSAGVGHLDDLEDRPGRTAMHGGKGRRDTNPSFILRVSLNASHAGSPMPWATTSA